MGMDVASGMDVAVGAVFVWEAVVGAGFAAWGDSVEVSGRSEVQEAIRKTVSTRRDRTNGRAILGKGVLIIILRLCFQILLVIRLGFVAGFYLRGRRVLVRAYRGMFPCFFGGRVSFLSLSISRAAIMRGRVSLGSMTSSRKP